MLFEIGILIATYYGKKYYDKNKDVIHAEKEKIKEEFSYCLNTGKKTPQSKGPENRSPGADNGAGPDGTSMKNGAPISGTEESRKELEHYSHMGLLSIGLSAVTQLINPAMAPISLGVYIYTTLPYLKEVEKSMIKEGKVDVNVLFFIADMMALGISQYMAASAGVWLMHSGKLSVEKAKGVAEEMIVDVFEHLPREAWLVVDGVERKVPLDQVQVSDILAVSTGEVVPVDGVVLEGMASIDQHALTGESQPAETGPGDRVFAGTLVITGRIRIRVESSGQDTTVSKISRILCDSTNFKSKVQLKGEQWADKATVPMLAMSFFILPTFGPVSTCVFINSHIGNRIKILAPLITLNHLCEAAQHGILIKDGRAIEALCEVDTVLFDKTGTLTDEVPEIGEIIACDRYDENRILAYAAAAECRLTHPIARAFVRKVQEAGLSVPEVEDSQYRIGYGITVQLQEKTIRVGSSRFMDAEGIAIPASITRRQEAAHGKGSSHILVAEGEKVCGSVEIRPQVRPEVRNIVKELGKLGIKHTAIVSGDHERPTRELAEELGVSEYFHDTLPESKALIVERLRREGRCVCYIGDGVNDAIAMEKANVSISIRGASTLATDMAEIVFMDGSMANLCELFAIGGRLDQKLKRSLRYTIAPGVLNLGGAFVIGYGILTSLVVNGTFAVLGMRDAMVPQGELPHEKMKQELAKDSVKGRP